MLDMKTAVLQITLQSPTTHHLTTQLEHWQKCTRNAEHQEHTMQRHNNSQLETAGDLASRLDGDQTKYTSS